MTQATIRRQRNALAAFAAATIVAAAFWLGGHLAPEPTTTPAVVAIAPAPAPTALAPGASAGKCLPGYQWYPGRNECVRHFKEHLAEVARCKPGTVREVPDPTRGPGFRRVQVCRNRVDP